MSCQVLIFSRNSSIVPPPHTHDKTGSRLSVRTRMQVTLHWLQQQKERWKLTLTKRSQHKFLRFWFQISLKKYFPCATITSVDETKGSETSLNKEIARIKSTHQGKVFTEGVMKGTGGHRLYFWHGATVPLPSAALKHSAHQVRFHTATCNTNTTDTPTNVWLQGYFSGKPSFSTGSHNIMRHRRPFTCPDMSINNKTVCSHTSTPCCSDKQTNNGLVVTRWVLVRIPASPDVWCSLN